MAGNAGFVRWYDRVPELSQAVRSMEKMSTNQQRLIAHAIVKTSSLSEITQPQDSGLKKLGTDKVMGLMKAKNKRRWYDQDPVVHQAFNYLYLMNDALRYEMAIKMLIAIKVLQEANKNQNYEFMNPQSPIIQAIFNQNLQYLMNKTEFTMNAEGSAQISLTHIESTAPEEWVEDSNFDITPEGIRITRTRKRVSVPPTN